MVSTGEVCHLTCFVTDVPGSGEEIISKQVWRQKRSSKKQSGRTTATCCLEPRCMHSRVDSTDRHTHTD